MFPSEKQRALQAEEAIRRADTRIIITISLRTTITADRAVIHSLLLSSLPHLIDCYEGEVLYSQETITKMVEATETAKCPESYPLPLDIAEFKQDFANLMVALEEASEEPEDEEPIQPEHPATVAIAIPLWRKIAKATAAVIPVFGVAALAAFGISKAVKG